MTKSRRRIGQTSPVRTLVVTQLEPKPPVIGPLMTKPRQHPSQPRKRNRSSQGQSRRSDQLRSLQLSRKPHQISTGRHTTRPGRPDQRSSRHTQRRQHSLTQIFRKRNTRSSSHSGRQNLEASIGVEPTITRRSNHLVLVESKPGRMRDQMPHGRPRRPSRLIPLNSPLLNRDQSGIRGEQLGHRSQPERPILRPVRTQHRATGRNNRGSRRLDRPVPDHPNAVHAKKVRDSDETGDHGSPMYTSRVAPKVIIAHWLATVAMGSHPEDPPDRA